MFGKKIMNESNYLNELFRPKLEKGNRDQYICIDKNEPPFSAFELVKDLITDEDIKNLRVYPDPYELYEKLSNFVGVSIEKLLITQGSEQAIEFVFRVFVNENDEVIYLNPSFAMFDVYSYIQKAKIKYINFEDNISLKIESVINSITESTKLFVLANPNNPTGTSFNLEELELIAKHTEKTNTIFLLDEAYFYFYNIDSISLINKYKNLIITRTFSKALGIAGARVGYAISQINNIDLLRKIKPIDEINQLSNILAKKVIDNSQIILKKNIDQVNKWKKKFENTDFTNLEYINTEGNFILLKSLNYEYHKKIFLNNKIFPKMDFKEFYLSNCFRLSISDDVTMERIFYLLNNNISSQLNGWDEEETIEFYSNFRIKYDDLYESEKFFLTKEFISKQDTILDVGCSAGGMSSIIHSLNPNIKYTGLDVSKNAIEKANYIYSDKKTDFYYYDGINEFPLKNRYDLVFCSGVMHLIDNYKFILNGMVEKSNKYLVVDFRVTTKKSYKGKFYFSFLDKTNPLNYTNYFVLNFGDLISLFDEYENIKSLNIFGYKGEASSMSEGIDEVYMLFFKIELGKNHEEMKIIFENDKLKEIFDDNCNK
jgi:histidinol-phosphate aminotransferase